MQLTPRQAVLQFGHVLQQQLFPHLEAAVGGLSPQLELLASVVALAPLEDGWARVAPAPAGQPKIGRLWPQLSSPKPSSICPPHATSWVVCGSTVRCGNSAAGPVGARCRTNPSFPAPLPNSRTGSCRSICMRQFGHPEPPSDRPHCSGLHCHPGAGAFSGNGEGAEAGRNKPRRKPQRFPTSQSLRTRHTHSAPAASKTGGQAGGTAAALRHWRQEEQSGS